MFFRAKSELNRAGAKGEVLVLGGSDFCNGFWTWSFFCGEGGLWFSLSTDCTCEARRGETEAVVSRALPSEAAVEVPAV